jgi:hypothetical protein
VAALTLALAAATLAASESSAEAEPAYIPGMSSATMAQPLLARHRFRHRHRGMLQNNQPEMVPPAAAASPGKPVPQTVPPPAAEHKPPASAAKDVKGKPPEATREPMGPPPPPARWSAAETEAARKDCERMLSGLHVLFDRLDPIRDGVCGLPAPIRLKGFENGRNPKLTFTPAPVLSCKLAAALRRWSDVSLQAEAKKYLDADIVGVAVLTSYNCRSRYDNPDQRISQHAFANAIDISEFVTAKGERIAVLESWNATGPQSAFLRAIHTGACQIFGTALGPEANAAHKNHFHLDMKERRQPLCDFTPAQLRAREEAKKHPVPLETVAPAPGGKGGPKVSSSQLPTAPKPASLPEAAKPKATAPAPPAAAKEHRRHHRRHHRFLS